MGIDVGAKILVPMHWGTIYLGEGPPHELQARFVAAALENGRNSEDTWVMRIGETRVLPPPATHRSPPTLLAAEAVARPD
jgi:L-ascorbate metabolism protein UlaG (beta-lactamase superfamily)